MECPVCKNAIREGDTYCQKCGEKFVWGKQDLQETRKEENRKLPRKSSIISLWAFVSLIWGWTIILIAWEFSSYWYIQTPLITLIILFAWSPGLALSITAIVLGRIAVKRIKTEETKKKVSILELVLGVSSLIIIVLCVFATTALFFGSWE